MKQWKSPANRKRRRSRKDDGGLLAILSILCFPIAILMLLLGYKPKK